MRKAKPKLIPTGQAKQRGWMPLERELFLRCCTRVLFIGAHIPLSEYEEDRGLLELLAQYYIANHKPRKMTEEEIAAAVDFFASRPGTTAEAAQRMVTQRLGGGVSFETVRKYSNRHGKRKAQLDEERDDARKAEKEYDDWPPQERAKWRSRFLEYEKQLAALGEEYERKKGELFAHFFPTDELP